MQGERDVVDAGPGDDDAHERDDHDREHAPAGGPLAHESAEHAAGHEQHEGEADHRRVEGRQVGVAEGASPVVRDEREGDGEGDRERALQAGHPDHQVGERGDERERDDHEQVDAEEGGAGDPVDRPRRTCSR